VPGNGGVQILVGPADSGEQSSAAGAKEGKYHMQNVPAGQVGPGVYELGVTAPSWSKQRSTRALRTEDVIPVYIGQSANIIQRLQKHGLAATHHDQPDPRYGKPVLMIIIIIIIIIFLKSHDVKLPDS
jgi:hypothetical protein